MTPADVTARPVRERILTAACDLFYNQGYRATGINQIIETSGVAKASLYQHFPTKSDLLIAYANQMAEQDYADIRAFVFARPTPQERFEAPFDLLLPWFQSTDYRGCPFQNVMSELPPPCQTAQDPAAARETQAVHAIARQHRENLRGLFRELYSDLRKASPDLPAHDIDAIADHYLILFEGCIAATVAYREPWPIERARTALHRLLNNR